MQKFREAKGCDNDGLSALYNMIDDTEETNRVVNSLKTVDPAVRYGKDAVDPKKKREKEQKKLHLAILNSRLSEWYFNLIGTTTGMGTNRWKKYKIEYLPIKEPSNKVLRKTERLVDDIINARKHNPAANTAALEKEIDQLGYQLYDLTDEEIQIIESA